MEQAAVPLSGPDQTASGAREPSRFRLDRTIKVGECLTIVTIALSVVALVSSYAKDRALRTHEQANQVRQAAGTTLARVDRLQVLSLAVFDDLQPLFIDVSQDFGRSHDAVAARDLFWKGVEDVRLRAQDRVRDEQIETAYIGLVGFDPEVRKRFEVALRRRSELEQEMFNALLVEGQEDVFAFENVKDYTSSQMGNALRTTAARRQADYDAKLKATLGPLQSYLLGLLTQSDDAIVHKRP